MQDATNLHNREVNSIKQELRQKQQEYQEDLEQKQQQYQKDLEERLAQQQQQLQGGPSAKAAAITRKT